MTETDPKRLRARELYFRGETVAEIAMGLGLPYSTVDSWKRRDEWDLAGTVVRVESGIERRLAIVIGKDTKSDRDFQEIEALTKTLERMARIRKFEGSGKESDLNPNINKRNEARREKQAKGKNRLTEDQVQALTDAFQANLFGYQNTWWWAKGQHRVRNILKSRQIGATWYFAREAVVDAVTTGDNQIFLSASKAQAHVFKEYIIDFVKEVTGVLLTGDPIKLWNGATLYFLGTNSKTAQSYHGHVYLDEYAWIGKFAEFRKVASAMATHKKWRLTYFSTPSTINHQANGFWSGATYNKGKAEPVDFDTSHDTLKDGAVCPDGQWRHMVTIHDAEAAGCNLFDLEALRREYNDEDFANLFLCEWVNDAQSFFRFDELNKCMVDSLDRWPDFDPTADRPFGDRPVWIGYDPARTRDAATIAVVAPPLPGAGREPYRLLEKIHLPDVDFQSQANRIEALTTRYRVTRIAIDCTGIGAGVYEMVKLFRADAIPLTYSVEVKARMVLKAKGLIAKKRFHFDSGAYDVVQAFLQIKKTMTASGRQMTFAASRTEETGHADVAWAVMHALDAIEFSAIPETEDGARRGRAVMEIF
jgi:uncharacterized protein YjcR